MNRIIAVSREFGSGGRELGKRLAEKLGFAYYDRELIELLAKETKLSGAYIENISERGIYPIPYRKANSFVRYSALQKQQVDVMVAEKKILQQIADSGDCVIVGRCAGEILKEHRPFTLFVYADMPSKMSRCREKREDQNLSDRELIKAIKATDARRRQYHAFLTNTKWGDKENYDLCINTSGKEIRAMIEPLADYILRVSDWKERT